MPVLQKTIRDRRLKSIELTYFQRLQQREMLDYFITSVCRTGAVRPTSFPASVVTMYACNGHKQNLHLVSRTDAGNGGTNKTERDARYRTLITIVLDSQRSYVPKLTLKSALEELPRWQKTGISCFRRLVITRIANRAGRVI